MTDLQKWESGADLGHSIIKFADPYQVAKYRNASTEGAIIAYKQLLFLDVFSQLYSKELFAFGFRITPNLSDGPMAIPHHVFGIDPDVDAASEDKVKASGVEYERVRIVRAISEESKPPTAKPIESHKAGRPDTYGMSKSVLNALFSKGINHPISAAKLHPEFQAEFEKQYPLNQHKTPAPSEKTLRKQLRTYRKESEEKDNNDLAE